MNTKGITYIYKSYTMGQQVKKFKGLQHLVIRCKIDKQSTLIEMYRKFTSIKPNENRELTAFQYHT